MRLKLRFALLAACALAAGMLTSCRHAGMHASVYPVERVGNIERTGFDEPSGICFHTTRGTLFLVGDDGDVGEMNTDGAMLHARHVRDADFEGITHDPATGLLYVAHEGAERILELDPDSLTVLREFQLPREAEGRTLMKRGGNGIEAITFVPDEEHPQGGTFYVTNQVFTLDIPDDPSVIIHVELPLRESSLEPRILDWFEPGVADLSGLHYITSSGNLLVISDSGNLMSEYTTDYEFVGAWSLPGDNQEGITFDDDGYLYIAQDSGGVLKFGLLQGE